uniref:Uncharacterized protein n=1 Tax=Panagrolaimus davidi TaxID=227884 RepID=A0A914R022_9BILA
MCPDKHKFKFFYSKGFAIFCLSQNGCAKGLVYDAGLCYPECQGNYNGVGPICWDTCPNGKFGYEALCLNSADECIKDMLSNGQEVGLAVAEIASDPEDALLALGKIIVKLAPELANPICSGVDPDHNHLKGPINAHDYIMDILKKYNSESNDPYYSVPTKILVSGVENVGKEYLYRFNVTFAKVPCLKTEFNYDHFDNCYASISHDISPTDLPTKVFNVEIKINGEIYEIKFE